MEIRKANINNVKDISRIHALSWKTAYKGMIPQDYLDSLKEDFWVAAFENWISTNTLTVQLIYDNNTVIGCIAYGKSRDSALPDWAEIISIYVLPEYFGKQYGKALLEKALTNLKAIGYKNVYLWVLTENFRAQRFYKKHGFSESEDKITCEISGKELIDCRFIYQFK